MYHIMKYVLYIISVFFLITACKREKTEVNPSQEEEKKEIISEDSLIAADRIFYRDSLKFVNIYPNSEEGYGYLNRKPANLKVYKVNEVSVFPKFGYYVNLSIPYRLSQKEPLLTKKEINKQKYYFSLTGKRKEQILEQLHLKQTDTVYAYSIKKDKLDTYLIKDLEMIAYNPIEIIEGKIEEKYFDVGLLLSYSEEIDTLYKGKEYDYASIEDGNIFQTGKIKRIESVKIKNIDIPFPINYSLLDKYAYYEYPISLHIDNTYKGKINNADFYMQAFSNWDKLNERWDERMIYLMIVKDNKKVIERVFGGNGIATVWMYKNFYIGNFIKGKPDIIENIVFYSYDHWLTFLSENEPPIFVLSSYEEEYKDFYQGLEFLK